jgi:hypothetical protein
MALRPVHLGRAVAALAALLLCSLPGVVHAGGRVFLVPVGGGLREPAERARLTPLLGALGFEQLSWVELADIEEHFSLVSIVDLRADEACGGEVALLDWSARLAEAQEQVQLLAAERALGELASLSLDVSCLDEVPRQADLVLLSLVTAEAHSVASSTVSDAGMRVFHHDEQQHALAMAASFGPDLPPPSWLAPDLSERLRDLQARFEAGESVPVYFGGTAKGLWLDGKQVTTGFRRLTPGQHLVQATWGRDVVAAQMIHVAAGRRTIVHVTPGELAVTSEDLVIELQRLGAGASPAPVLAELLGLLAQDADDALIVSLGDDGPRLWGRGRGGVVLRYPDGDLEPRALSFDDVGEEPAPPRRVRPDPIPWTLGAGASMLWSDIAEGPLEGLGGLCGGPALDARVALGQDFAAALALHPVARAEALPSGYDDSWLWRAMIPARAGLRFGAPRPVLHAEVGLDVGLLYLGRFQDHELRALGVGAAGVFLPLAPSFGLRLEGWGGLGAGFVTAGLQLVGVGHPAPPLSPEQP